MSGTCSARLLGRACANVVLNTATDGRSGPLGKLKALAYCRARSEFQNSIWAWNLIVSVVTASRGHQVTMDKFEFGRKLQATGIPCARNSRDPGWDSDGSFLGQAINQEY